MEDDASISLGCLKIWISDRQFPDSSDYWDGNWLLATAVCQGTGSRIEVSGPFVHLSEFKKWKADLEEFNLTLKGSVSLPAMEPTLGIKIEETKSSTGRLHCEVSLSGDHISEAHNYLFDIDQSYLTGLIGQLATILRAYPLK